MQMIQSFFVLGGYEYI